MSNRIIIGDALPELRKLPGESVHCCVTSPPYYGLRDYGTAVWNGGDGECSHQPPPEWGEKSFNANSSLAGVSGQAAAGRKRWFLADGSCRCGAVRIDQQIGLEPSPDEYVAALVAVFREVRRVLRRDGTLWLVIGDSYAANRSYQVSDNKHQTHDYGASNALRVPNGCKPKDLIGIPWMLAFALRADGWWLRQDIIWSKPNPMPESVTDRCTKSHEYLFLLSRSERYYYDAVAIAEPSIYAGYQAAICRGSKRRAYSMGREPSGNEKPGSNWIQPLIRNRRSVWEVTTQPFSEAHFATFPPALIEPCIKAGCPVDGTVLDPFGGAGTTGLVADRLGRNAILIELNPEYAAMARRRIEDDAPLFAEVS